MIYDVTHLCYMLKCPTHTRHKAFLMMTFMNWLLIKYVKTLFRTNDINIFKLNWFLVLRETVVTLFMDQNGSNFGLLCWWGFASKYFSANI